MIDLDEITSALARHRAARIDPEGKNQAAVAMILRGGSSGPEVLLIERAHHELDPWSGHMAFPGGRVELADSHPRAAAERETLEEVGLELRSGIHLGRLGDLTGRGAPRQGGLVISGHVYRLDDPGALALEAREVRTAFWFPIIELHDRARHVDHSYPGASMNFPGLLVGEPGRHVVWGLTYRFIEVFFQIVGRPLPERWSFEREAALAEEDGGASVR